MPIDHSIVLDKSQIDGRGEEKCVDHPNRSACPRPCHLDALPLSFCSFLTSLGEFPSALQSTVNPFGLATGARG